MARSTLRFEDTAGKLWCIVTQADSSCISLRPRDDAKGQDLLDAVSSKFQHVFAKGQSPVVKMSSIFAQNLIYIHCKNRVKMLKFI